MVRIIAVDDEAEVLRVVERELSRAGFHVSPARSVAEARALMAAQSFDAAVVDYHLEDGSGLDLLGELREASPACARVLVTGFLDLPVALRAVNSGEVSRVLEKPFAGAELVAAVRESLDGSRRRVAEYRRIRGCTTEERHSLERCLGSTGFQLAVQPIVTALQGEVVGYEALIRSDDPLLPDPLAILDLAERHRMLREVGNAVVARATRWLFALPDEQSLFINLHPDELADMDALVERLGPLVPWSERIVLEVTGRSHERWSRDFRERLGRLRALGFRFAIDDLGAGQGALVLLAEAEPVFIKADMSIIRGVDHDPRKRRLVELLCRFAEATGARLVAEGVETDAEAMVLRDVGVPLMQGYLFGRPAMELARAA